MQNLGMGWRRIIAEEEKVDMEVVKCVDLHLRSSFYMPTGARKTTGRS